MPVAEPLIKGKGLEELRVVDLKEELEKRNLSKSGNKNVLLERLREALLAEQSGGAATLVASGPNRAETTAEPVVANPLVAEYLAKQQQALLTARKEAEAARAATSSNTTATSPVSSSQPPPQVVASPPPPQKVQQQQEKAKTAVPANSSEPTGPSPSVPDSSSPQKNDGGRRETRSRREEAPHGDGRVEEAAEDREKKEENGLTTVSPKEDGKRGKRSVQRAVVETTEEPAAEAPKPERKRKWGKTSAGKRSAGFTISSDSLKDLGLPSVKEAVEAAMPDEHNIELDYDEHERVVTQDGGEEQGGGAKKAARIVVEEMEAEEERKRSSPERPERAEVMTEEGLVRGKSPSPARYPVSRVIHVRCLTRPFTSKQLHDLLGTFGGFEVKEDFWIDSIRSNCIVKYATVEEASKAREGLHNVQWPPGSPKLLRVDYSTEEDLERHKKGADQVVNKEEAGEDQRNNDKVERRVRRSPSPAKNHRRSSSPKLARDSNAREWDKGKTFKPGQSPPREERRRERERDRRSSPANRGNDGSAKPAKLLDDLFKKTKTTPSLYWIPLTESQIVERDRKKKEYEAERAERVEKMRRMEEEERAMRGPPRDPRDDRGFGRRRSPPPVDRYRRR